MNPAQIRPERIISLGSSRRFSEAAATKDSSTRSCRFITIPEAETTMRLSRRSDGIRNKAIPKQPPFCRSITTTHAGTTITSLQQRSAAGENFPTAGIYTTRSARFTSTTHRRPATPNLRPYFGRFTCIHATGKRNGAIFSRSGIVGRTEKKRGAAFYSDWVLRVPAMKKRLGRFGRSTVRAMIFTAQISAIPSRSPDRLKTASASKVQIGCSRSITTKAETKTAATTSFTPCPTFSG